MEKKVVYLWSVIVLLSVVLSSALTLDIPVYFKVGGSLELRPQPEHTAITGIVWRHNGDLVAEWVDKDSPLTYWGVFKGRTTLNTTTGRLEIRKMSKDDAGLFTVEINKVQNESYAARVVKEVSKPTVLVACSPALESCVLSCDGDTTETGPVDYYWKFGDRGWKQRFCGQIYPKYVKVGGSLELRPQPEQTAITSIVWRHNGDLVAEWVDKESPLTYWGSFKGRTTLNTTTGRLEIRNMGKNDTGLFTVEINNKVQSDRYPAKVVKEVSKPTVLVKPLACSPALESCVLSCDGDTTETGPVDYYWKFGDGGWKQREKDITINKTEEMQSAKTVSCRMKNLAGEKDSDPVENPFFKEPNGSVGLGVGLFLLSVVVLAGGVVGYWKRESIKELVCPHNNGNNGDASNRQCDGTLQESQQLNDVEKSDKDGKVTQ
uniref:uncharacterized protein LOC109963828 n=1 Tax=Monopterus albus TaxID=43700 RepID=UPI0009B3448A|nr:uncharacterized protein LOC109963828 [Monopterus albus]